MKTAPALATLLIVSFSANADDPLPSWNDTSTKQAIVAYVHNVTDPSGPSFIPVPEHVAVFDNDGTLWPEDPIPFQLAFVIDEIKAVAPSRPDWKDDRFVQAALKDDFAPLFADHYAGVFHLYELTMTGLTTDDYSRRVEAWLASAKHPRWQKPYTSLAYQPMLELLAYMRANGFKTFIVSGGGADFIRVWSEKTYGIPPEQVAGTFVLPVFELRDGKPVLIESSRGLFVNDGPGKPVGIHHFIGRRPVACFGNSDGDQAMLEYTTIDNPRPSFGLIVHHTDAEREYAYDANPAGSGKLTTALTEAAQRGWTVVDMKKDWKTIFAP